MRWRVIDEVKAGKGENICANVECPRIQELQSMEVVFGYVEEGERRDVLVKCVLCPKCTRKMKKSRGGGEERRRKRRRRSNSVEEEDGDNDIEKQQKGREEVRKAKKRGQNTDEVESG